MSFVHASRTCSFGISRKGKVYAWGKVFEGQRTGAKTKNDRSLFQVEVKAGSEEVKVKRVSGSMYKYGFLDREDNLYMMGTK
jgi:alpha-tubulin suppressor-like RCC1 family protein